MTLEEAKKKVVKDGCLRKIGEVLDYGDFWVFCLTDEDMDLDYSPPAINKSTGEYIDYFPPEFKDKKYVVL